MLVMQGNELAVSLGFVGEVVLFSSSCFGKKKTLISVFLFFAPGCSSRWSNKEICQQDRCELSNKTANKVCKHTRDGLFYR